MAGKDVAIIGGSTAGLFTGYLLARQGLRVRVFEATESFAVPPRTLIVTSYLRSLLGHLAEDAVVNEIRRFELYGDGRVARVSLRQPDLVIERSRFIQHLAARAEEAGVQVLTGRRFLSLAPGEKGLNLAVSSNGTQMEESADILVGADGAFSRVARRAGWPDHPRVPLVQAVVDLPEDMSPDSTRIWFLPEETPYFYWLIPHSRTRGVLGLIGEEAAAARRSLEWFLEKKGLAAAEFQSAMIPLYTRWVPNYRRVGQGHVYLVGDAAGHVKVTTVGGIVTGFRGALGVAEAILNGGRSRELRALRRELDRHLLIRKVLHRFSQADYAALLDVLTEPTRRSLGLISRDETARLLFDVLAKQPRLLLLALRSLLLGR